MPRSAPLEPYLNFFFDISNNKLGHAFPPVSSRYHDIIPGIFQQYLRSTRSKARQDQATRRAKSSEPQRRTNTKVTYAPNSKLDHAASLISSDAASAQKATLQHRTIKRKFINACYDALYLRWIVARDSQIVSTRIVLTRDSPMSLESAVMAELGCHRHELSCDLHRQPAY